MKSKRVGQADDTFFYLFLFFHESPDQNDKENKTKYISIIHRRVIKKEEDRRNTQIYAVSKYACIRRV